MSHEKHCAQSNDAPVYAVDSPKYNSIRSESSCKTRVREKYGSRKPSQAGPSRPHQGAKLLPEVE